MFTELSDRQMDLLLFGVLLLAAVFILTWAWEHRETFLSWFRSEPAEGAEAALRNGRLFADAELAHPKDPKAIQERVTQDYGGALDERELLMKQAQNLEAAINAVGAEFERRRTNTPSTQQAPNA